MFMLLRQGRQGSAYPVIKECILDVDIENQLIRVHLLDGLL